MRSIVISLAALMAAMLVSKESYAQPKAVDLGLSVKWADRNVGADAPAECGYHFAWGETKTKSTYTEGNYKWCKGTFLNQTKYCTDSKYGTVDFETKLEIADDAAHANWGGRWRMPTKDEFEELKNKCKWVWTNQGGNNGYKVTGPNGNSIFLPADGFRRDFDLRDASSSGYYWSSSLRTDHPRHAWYWFFNSKSVRTNGNYRYHGFSVRPVLASEVSSAKPKAVDLGLSVKWADRNVGADAPTGYGDYFAWGETKPKSKYDWDTYKWCKGSSDTQTKYCTDSKYGTVDNKTKLEIADDAAHANWGGKWRMPTKAQIEELKNKCKWVWTNQEGNNGYKVTGLNGNSIFLPAAGIRYDSNLYSTGSYGYFWSSSLNSDGPDDAWRVSFDSGEVIRYDTYRYYGLSVRPVTE